ncbi:hypothetical protein [Mycolicibacterium sediminis]|uniref:Uncharacterized protein n=1 Tax=Mycolicibacterium sediminis TaxID=1286180 RepID=A0A7I7QNA4_9MYCO|nr:hypothetical protein [Mycolicibacterium sediminis]BBY27879.1 hypothetical protein MSEDJ_19750 [Mycolicibacterium sediminis]
MRFLAALLLWVLTTVALAVAVPAAWAQHTIVDRDGYAEFAASAAREPQVQQAMATLLTNEIVSFAQENGYGDLNPDLVASVTTGYTQNAGFPGQFAAANRIAHTWMFTDTVQRDQTADDRWLVDIAPMLKDSSLRDTLGNVDLEVPDTLNVPITIPDSSGLRPGQLRSLATWGPWVSVGAIVVTGILALLTLAASRSRGRALVALGVSALIVGAAGWAGIEIGRRYAETALTKTQGEVRAIADVMIGHAIDSMHLWLNLVLAAGGVLVVLGVLAAMLGGLGRRRVTEPAR